MATNNFKAFSIGAGANVTSQADYEALTALLTGFQSGKASSAQINKALRQSSTMAYVLAQFISDSLNADVLDNGAPANILASMKAAMTKLTPGRLLNVQTLTQSGTYTKTPGTNLIFVRLWGAGGGGANTSVVGGGGSGAGGGYCEGIFDTSYFNTTTLTVGLGGVAVAGNTQASGGNGGRTQFGNLIGASGGGGGGVNATGGIPDLGGNRLAFYGQGGQGSQGGIGGTGGATFGAFGGLPHASSPGDAGGFPGGGGAGGTKISTSQYFASGAGANGLIIIEEYS